MKITLLSRGLKSAGVFPTKADLYLDARSIPDPASVAGLKNDPYAMNKLFKEINGLDIVDRFMPLVQDCVKSLPSRRINSMGKKNPNYCTVVCFCAYGIHRSVALKKMLAAEIILKQPTWEVEVI